MGVTGHATGGVPAVRALIGSGLRSECRSVGSVTDSDVRGGGEEHLLLPGTWSDWYEHDLSVVKLSLYIYLVLTCIISVYTLRATQRIKTISLSL